MMSSSIGSTRPWPNQKLIGGEHELRGEIVLHRPVTSGDLQQFAAPHRLRGEAIIDAERAHNVPRLDRRDDRHALTGFDGNLNDARTPQRPLVFIATASFDAIDHVLQLTLV